MQPIIDILIHWTIVGLLYVVMMAGTAHALGIAVREVSFGIGRSVFERGWFRIGWLPFGGYVTMVSTQDVDFSESQRSKAHDVAPKWRQIAVPLVGLAILFAFSCAVLGSAALDAFLSGFHQVLVGALGPFSTAQSCLHSGVAFAREQTTLQLAALISAKLVALNLLPFAGLNGLNVILILLRRSSVASIWETRLQQWLIWPTLLILFSWAVAVARFLWLWYFATDGVGR